MPPTISNTFGHSTPLVSQTLLDCERYVNCINNQQTRKLAFILAPRNDTGVQGDVHPTTPDATALDTTVSDTTLDSFAPYEPSFPLHPSTIPASATSEPSAPPRLGPHSRPHINTTAVVITFSVAFTIILGGLLLIMLLRRIRRWNLFQRGIWFNSRKRKHDMTNFTLENEPIVFIGVDYAGENALIHDTTMDLDLESKSTCNTVVNEVFGGPPCIPPSIISADSLASYPDYGTPTMTEFQQRLDAEEVDITMAIGLAMRDCTYSGSELSTLSQSADLTAVGGYWQGWETKNRTRKCSDASDSTKPTTEFDGFSIAPTAGSSLTSITEIPHDSDFEELDIDEATEIEMETGDMVFEVARAQAQSMEIKRGVLFNWCSQRASLSPVLEEMETSASLKSLTLPSASFTTVPSLVVTCPSMITIPHIRPSFSSVSIDLDEFPLPPSAFNYGKPFDDFDMCTPVILELDDSRMSTCSMRA